MKKTRSTIVSVAVLEASKTASAQFQKIIADLGLTVKEVSQATGVPVGTINKILRGDSPLGLGRLCELAIALDLDINITLVPAKNDSGGVVVQDTQLVIDFEQSPEAQDNDVTTVPAVLSTPSDGTGAVHTEVEA